jgi:hypothetical protein
VGRHDPDIAELNAHRRKVDAQTRALENRIFEETTRNIGGAREQRPTPPCADLPEIDLTGDPDRDENGQF